jgi:hypothetical protein
VLGSSFGPRWRCRHNTGMQEVDVNPRSPERLTPLIMAERLRFAVEEDRQAIDGATVWHINATAHGGGVAEILTSTLLGMAVNRGRKARASGRRKRRTAGRARPHQRAIDRAPNPRGGCACGATDKPLQRDCVLPTVPRLAVHARNVVLAWPSCNTSKCNDEVTGWLRRKRLDERALLLRYVELRMALPLNVSAEPDAELAAPETNRKAFPNRTRVLWPSLHVEGGSRSGGILDLDAGRAILHGTL